VRSERNLHQKRFNNGREYDHKREKNRISTPRLPADQKDLFLAVEQGGHPAILLCHSDLSLGSVVNGSRLTSPAAGHNSLCEGGLNGSAAAQDRFQTLYRVVDRPPFCDDKTRFDGATESAQKTRHSRVRNPVQIKKQS
jgi:hypothetical protein